MIVDSGLYLNEVETVGEVVQVLNHYLDSLKKSKLSYRNYCNRLRLQVVPLVEKVNPRLIASWDNAYEEYTNEYHNLKRATFSEVQELQAFLERKLSQECLLNNPNIKMANERLKTVLELRFEEYEVGEQTLKGLWGSPTLSQVAVDRLKSLFYAIVASGRKDLVENYVMSFSKVKTYETLPCEAKTKTCNLCRRFYEEELLFHCPDCDGLRSEPTIREEFYIEFFHEEKFVPSFFKWLDLQEAFSQSSANSWMILKLIQQNWLAERRDDFRKKLPLVTEGKWKDQKIIEQNMELLNRNLLHREVQAIKKQEYTKVHIFQRACIEKALNTVVKSLLETFSLQKNKSVNGPVAVRLSCKDEDLLLWKYWSHGLVEICWLHTFQSTDREKNLRCSFIKKLLVEPHEFVVIDLDAATGADAKKYLKASRIKGAVGRLFIAEAERRGAKLRGRYIGLEKLTPKDVYPYALSTLDRELDELEPLDWVDTKCLTAHMWYEE